ncbi:hypothetical protein tinsulaeT_18840 [Thalassotalea insulae]|uniref:Uncharacterized protein n=1 Tax=Thalassotalea insulae TaxID=2056778 RepID=A0ABQ6GT93_9GAMM|nr:hypothetical protein [Thalassotalea insulae]GLX78544.1 hypothetical protein tinsulaeT_18840 [Thalassotalea insulae]
MATIYQVSELAKVSIKDIYQQKKLAIQHLFQPPLIVRDAVMAV